MTRQDTLRQHAFAPLFKRVQRYKYSLLLLLPTIVYFVVFKYVPMYGIVIAFKQYRFADGILGSDWVGLKYFSRMFSSASFTQVVRNTFVISFLKLFLAFPAPIVLALLFNDMSRPRFKKVTQTITYLPHFLSWVVLGAVIKDFLASTGPINSLIQQAGSKPIVFLAQPGWFLTIVVASEIWQTIGWGSIIYLAAISGINPELYESAEIDGAGRLAQMFYITVPSLLHVITIMFLLRVGQIMDAGFDQLFNLYNPLVYSVGDIIDTYTYRVGLVQLEYSFSTAVGWFKNVVGLALMLVVNSLTRRLQTSEFGLW